MNQLIANQLVKRYKNRAVVNQIDLLIKRGEIVGLLGPNGAGKTTTFYMLVGLVSCDEGSVKLDSLDITKAPIHKRARHGIGYLPQEASVFRKLSVEENLLAVLELNKTLSRNRMKKKAEELLEEFHITHLRKNLGLSLSGGERRRLEIARALATNPSFILLDEPFAGVDPISVIDIKQIINHLSNRDIGVLITDHNVRETLDICHRAYIVNNGKILTHGTSKEIIENAEVRKTYLGETFEL